MGDTPDLVKNNPAFFGMETPNTGAGRQASQLVTKILLMYTGQGSDGTSCLYAVNKATGERLVQVELPGRPRYGLSTFMHNGKWHVVVQVPNMLASIALP